MSNETIIFQPELFIFRLSGRRLTALPEAGTIASLVKDTVDATVVGGLFRTIAIAANGSNRHTATISVMPNSGDHAFIEGMRKAFRKTGQPASVNATYPNGSYWKSTSAVVLQAPTVNIIADNVEVLAYPLGGLFETNTVAFTNPEPLTEDQVNSFVGT